MDEIELPEVDYPMLMGSLSEYARPRDRISRLLRSGKLVRVKKGLYVRNDRRDPYSREVLANLIYGPSYLSFEFALSFHGLIPEAVTMVSSATTGRRKRFSTPVGEFEYLHLPERFFAPGVEWRPVDSRRGFLIASAAKALFDTLFIRTPRLERIDVEGHLFENLRLDEDEFDRIDFSAIEGALSDCARPSIAAFRGYLRRRKRIG
jgi:hypothetical protein